MQNVPPLTVPPPVAIFEHLTSLVPELVKELALNRRLGLVGMGSIGKTTLAREVFERVRGGYEHAFFIPVGATPERLQLLRRVWHEIFPQSAAPFENDEVQALTALTHQLAQKSVLLVLDDVWRPVRTSLSSSLQ